MIEYNGNPECIIERVSDIRHIIGHMAGRMLSMDEAERQRVHTYLEGAYEQLSQWCDVRTVQLVREDHE